MDRMLDSYQNEVATPGRESIEAVASDTAADDVNIQRDADPYAEAAMSYASDSLCDTNEAAERVVRATTDRRQRARDAQGRWLKG